MSKQPQCCQSYNFPVQEHSRKLFYGSYKHHFESISVVPEYSIHMAGSPKEAP